MDCPLRARGRNPDDTLDSVITTFTGLTTGTYAVGLQVTDDSSQVGLEVR